MRTRLLGWTLGLALVGCGAPSPEQAREQIEQAELSFDERGLLSAIGSGNTEVVQLFMDAGLDPNSFSDPSQAALAAASKRSNPEALETLLKAGATAEKIPGILVVPATRGDLWTLQRLLDAGATIDSLNANREYALVAAISNHRIDAANLLLARGANPDGPKRSDRLGRTPLVEAVKLGQLELVQTLLEAGANPNQLGGRPRLTALFEASRSGQTEIVTTLLEAGAQPMLGDQGIDAARAARNAGHHKIAEQIESHVAN